MAEPLTPAEQNYQASLPVDAEVFIVNRKTGERGVVAKSKLGFWQQAGFELESGGEIHAAAMAKQYGDEALQSGLQGAASVITFGGSDVALSELDPEGTEQIRKQSPNAFMGGMVGGALLTGGTGIGKGITQAGARVGSRVAERVGTGLGGRLAAAGSAAATEGAIYSLGSSTSELVLSRDPIDWENAAATIGSNALVGAAIGAPLGVGGKLLQEGAMAAKDYAGRQMDAARGVSAEQNATRSQFPDIADMDRKQARAAAKFTRESDVAEARVARETEESTLRAVRDVEAEHVYQEALAYKDVMRAADSFVPTSDRELAKQLKNSKRSIMNGLDNPKGFVESRGSRRVVDGLQVQEQALNKALANTDGVLAKAEESRAGLLESLPRKSPVPSPAELVDGQFYKVTASDLERAGLYELPGAGVDKTRMARVTSNLGKPETLNQPIRLTQDSSGRLFIDDGRHRLRAALEEGGGRTLDVEINRGAGGFDATMETVQLGKGGQGYYLTPEQAKLYAGYTGAKVPKGKSLAIAADELEAFREVLSGGTAQAVDVQRVQNAQRLLEQNLALQERIAAIKKPVTSPTMSKLDDVIAGTSKSERLEALEAHLADIQETPLSKKIAKGAGALVGGKVGFAAGGPLGAAAGGMAGAEIGGRFFDRISKRLSGGAATRAKSIKTSMAALFGKSSDAIKRTVPLATKTIPAIQYASDGYADTVLGKQNARDSDRAEVNAFRLRSRELDAMTERTHGQPTMRLDARRLYHQAMAGLWAINPDLANAVELIQARKLEFLAGKLPRDPAPPYLQVGPMTWEPSHAELAQFGRFMDAAEHPEAVVQRMATSTMTAEDVETLKTVYPSMYEDVRRQVMDNLSEVRETMPYAKRLNLSIFLDLPVDPSLTPQALRVYQKPPAPMEAEQPASRMKPMPTGMVEPTNAQRFSAK